MKDLNYRKEISKELELLKDMINANIEKEKIEKQKKILDKLLNEFLKDL